MEAVYVDHMGDDLRVVNSARVSFNKESNYNYYDTDGKGIEFPQEWEQENYPSKKLSEQDEKLIAFLARNNHWTPFSHVQITMREKVPIFVARQRFKHMVGFTYNEISRRYVDDEPEFFNESYGPIWRTKPETNKKQGSGDLGDGYFQDGSNTLYDDVLLVCKRSYNSLLELGVAPEQARVVLPQSMYTEYYVTGSLAAWTRAYKLRIDPHAQKEIQDLAIMWDKVISEIKGLEYSWKVLKDVK